MSLRERLVFDIQNRELIVPVTNLDRFLPYECFQIVFVRKFVEFFFHFYFLLSLKLQFQMTLLQFSYDLSLLSSCNLKRLCSNFFFTARTRDCRSSRSLCKNTQTSSTLSWMSTDNRQSVWSLRNHFVRSEILK